MALASLRRWWSGRSAARGRARPRRGARFGVRELETRLTPSLSTLASFSAPDGLNPYATLVMDGSGNLYGTTSAGGAFGDGTIFALAKGGTSVTTLASFNGTDGANPYAGLVIDASGNLYGTAYNGGASGYGTVFELAAGSSTITTLASFDGTDGSHPHDALILDGSGNLYGTAYQGGALNVGTVFEVAAGSGTITALASFDGSDGANPYASLVLDGGGNLYGTTPSGGGSGYGTVFEVKAGSGTITALASFSGVGGEGSSPVAGMVRDRSGNLYGTTSGGGGAGDGTVFEVVQGSRSITTLAAFNGSDGSFPEAGLILDASGNLYGTASAGGASGFGAVFEVAKSSGSIIALASFDGTSGADPQAGVVMDAGGNLYGTTVNGGTPNEGTVFELAAGSGTITTLATFSEPDGGNPWDTLIMDGSGNLYGTTQNGGAYGYGAIFELPHGSSTLTTLASFNGADGANPRDALLMDAGGNFYGTTYAGGASGLGTVFELAKGSSTVTTLWSFQGTNFGDGAYPYAGLVMDGSGNLYGTTSQGGSFNDGAVFELAAGSTTLTILASFNSTDGAGPRGGLLLDAGGNLYGTAPQGGASSDGVIYEVAAGSGTITDLAAFNRTDGQAPLGGLIADGSGNLYGTTQKGGHDFYGTVFEWVKSTAKINVLASFNGTTLGAYPYATPVMDSRGNIYGTSYVGGPSLDGTVFEVVKGSGKLTNLAAFDGTNGQGPLAGLLMDSSGDLFGTTSGHGPGGLGTVFELPGAAAVTDQWTGANFAVDTNWSDGANWSLGAPPTPGETALFTNNSSVKSFTSTVDAAFAGTVGGLVIDGTWGGTITVNSALTANGNFSMASGTLGGDGAMTVAGDAMQWTGGQIVVGSGGFTNTGVLTADTTGGNLIVSGTGTLTNQGTIHEAGTNNLMLENGATLNNTGTLDITDNGGVSQSGGGTLMNPGTVDKSGGTGTSTISAAFINSAAITVDKGTLTIASAGGTSTGGTFTVSKGATLDLTGGVSVAYAGSYTGTGLGTVTLRSGTLAVGAGGATFDMAGNLFQWAGGAIDVTNGTFTNTGTVNDPGTGSVILTGAGTLANDGTFVEAGARRLLVEKDATFDNAAGATFDLTANGSVRRSGRSKFTNEGTFEKTGGAGTSTVATTTFSNTGTVDVAKGTLDISATVTQVSGTTLTGGAWTVTGSAKVHATLDLTSAGSLTTIGSGAQVTLDGLNTTFTNLSGLTTVAQGGSFSLLGGQSFTTAGALTDQGSLTLGAGSVLTVSGSFTQTSSGALTVELGGTKSAPTIGQLVSTTGTVTLAGSLVVTSTVGPAVGSAFELLDNEGNAAVSGVFKNLPEGATIKVKKGTRTMKFQISYVGTDADGNQNVVLTRIA